MIMYMFYGLFVRMLLYNHFLNLIILNGFLYNVFISLPSFEVPCLKKLIIP